MVVQEYIELSSICEIRTETWISPNLKLDFLRISLVPNFDVLHFELRLTPYLAQN